MNTCSLIQQVELANNLESENYRNKSHTHISKLTVTMQYFGDWMCLAQEHNPAPVYSALPRILIQSPTQYAMLPTCWMLSLVFPLLFAISLFWVLRTSHLYPRLP